MNSKGLLVIISGPSGCGKGTVCNEIVKRNKNVRLSVSATTRDKRAGEEEGISYFYRTKEEFEQLIKDGKMLEYVCGYSGNYYGTPKDYVFSHLEEGRDVILEIEMNGGMHVKENAPESVSIFLLPPSKEELKARIVGRARESMELINERLKLVDSELERANEYDYVVVNDDLGECVKTVEAIIKAEKCSRKRNTEFIKELISE